MPVCNCGNEISEKRFQAGYDVCLVCGQRLAQNERLRKSRYVSLAYNKGPYMYITPETDPSSLGKKSGR